MTELSQLEPELLSDDVTGAMSSTSSRTTRPRTPSRRRSRSATARRRRSPSTARGPAACAPALSPGRAPRRRPP